MAPHTNPATIQCVYAYLENELLQEKYEVTADPGIMYNSLSFTNLAPNRLYMIEVSAETRIGDGARAIYELVMDHGLLILFLLQVL